MAERDREILEMTTAIDLMTEPEQARCNCSEILSAKTEDLYDGETRDIVLDVLQDATRHMRYSRRRDVLPRLLSQMGEKRIQKGE